MWIVFGNARTMMFYLKLLQTALAWLVAPPSVTSTHLVVEVATILSLLLKKKKKLKQC